MVPLHQFIVPFLAFIFFIVFLLKRRPSTPRKKPPPSPRKLPVIGNLHQVLGSSPHRSLQSLSNRYGELMLLHLGHLPVVVASSPYAAREIMKNQDLIFSNRPKLSIPERLTYASRDVAFAPYGEYWRQARHICVLQLLSTKRVQSFRRVREEETSITVEKIKRLSGSSPTTTPVINLSDMLSSFTNDVICRVALGRRYEAGDDGEGNKFKKFLPEFVELLGTPSLGEYFPSLVWIDRISGLDARVENAGKSFDEFLEGVLQEHRDRRRKKEKICRGDGDSDSGLDFVDILLDFQRQNRDGSSPVEDETIKALILDMFAAGTDTTVTVLDWAIAELVKKPKAMKLLEDEVRQVARAKGNKQEITEDDLEKMHYLKAVIKESLRLHSPIPLLIPRESTQDTKVLGYDIAAGTRVLINAWAIGRDPSFWEDPEEFRPERFLNSTVDFRGVHFELIPFGAGRRGCPGIAFATAVNELALAKLVKNFSFDLPNGGRKEDMDMSEANGITVHRKLPLLVIATSHFT